MLLSLIQTIRLSEASATALSQVMVRIYQDPAKYAKVAGMDVKKFTQLVKEDMNQAFIFFMSCLKKAGNMDVLSPCSKIWVRMALVRYLQCRLLLHISMR